MVAANWFMAAAFALGYSALIPRTRIEEGKLIERFGDEYREYMKRTGRYFPRWGG